LPLTLPLDAMILPSSRTTPGGKRNFMCGGDHRNVVTEVTPLPITTSLLGSIRSGAVKREKSVAPIVDREVQPGLGLGWERFGRCEANGVSMLGAMERGVRKRCLQDSQSEPSEVKVAQLADSDTNHPGSLCRRRSGWPGSASSAHDMPHSGGCGRRDFGRVPSARRYQPLGSRLAADQTRALNRQAHGDYDNWSVCGA
jgi:hypothetical protein